MTCKRSGGCWAAALSLAAALLPAAAFAAKPCNLQALELPATMVGARAVVTVGINGTQVPLALDSGAFFSALTPAAAQQLELKLRRLPAGMRIYGLTGEIESRVTTVKEMDLVGGKLPGIDFLVGGNEPGAGTMGLLGRNILGVTDAEYDLAHGVVRLIFPEGDCKGSQVAYWAKDQPLSEVDLLGLGSNNSAALLADARINDRSITVLFDTGALSTISLAAARKAGVDKADMQEMGRIHGAGEGSAQAWNAEFRRFQIGGETISKILVEVADYSDRDHDMLLGIDFFLSHRIYVSRGQRKMYFTYNGGPVFARSALELAKARAPGTEAPADAPPLADADAYARRGAAAAARLDFPRALADLDRACEMDPGVARHFLHRGTLRYRMNQAEAARQDFDTALKLDPAQGDARLMRAELLAQAREHQQALDDLQTLDRTLPTQSPLRLDMAHLYERLEQPDRALAQWTHWIDAHRKDVHLPGALNNRCWTRTLLNVELDEALTDCDQAVDLEPDKPSYRDSRGWLRLRRGELQKAQADFDQALKLKADHAWSLYGRGIVRARSGKPEQGQADLDAARKLLPSIDAEVARLGLPAGT
ncbi:tetratricopeptide repeat protein [Pelomonas sp. KK5]|uniref:aspartyl protease family protein n=1 Tax=Pelomonas sp. KK5 TaxID=1855730 RepID=UPI00097CA618|nr:tetratricopeptide repeat protein [Pelomonas sp. KK5]